jgi:hypothetical protein
MPPRPRPHPHPHPRPFPRHPHPGFYPRQPIVYDLPTQTFVVDSSASELPWRVVHISINGTAVVFRSADKADAVKFFLNTNNAQLGFNVTVALQYWTGAGWFPQPDDAHWATVARRNSQGNTVQGSLRGLGEDPVKEGITMGTAILAGITIIGLFYLL